MAQSYDDRPTKELVAIWKGFQPGDQTKVASILRRRIQETGQENAAGPGKIVYLEHGNLRFTVLTKSQVCRLKGILFEKES